MVTATVTTTDIRNASILVVDDKEDNVHLIEGILRIAGYTSVESTTDPHAVCELYRRGRHSLILLDLQMPGMDGFEVIRKLQEIEGDGYLPVLVITAQPEHKLRALEAGAKDFVSKPFNIAELRARVHNILEVPLLHLETRNYSKQLERTVLELEESREVIRIKTAAEQLRSEQELALAQETQESLLPRSLPAVEGYHLRAFNCPTRFVGGDFYDFLQLNSAQWMGVVADVSGKGMPAALLSSMLLGALNMEFRAGTPPAEVLNRVNRLLCEKSLQTQFATAFLFLLSPDGAGQFIGAGHEPARIFRACTGSIERLTSDQYIIGMFDFACYETREFHLSRGDILLVHSDGVTDARNDRDEMFGRERLLAILRQEAPSGSLALERKLLAAIAEFTRGVPQTDDITFVIVEKYQ
jgi:serine phosphatase RsbU (regulator of sigma subunit)